MNRALVSGNLGSDPELRYTQGGTAVLNLRLASNERRKKPGSDDWEDHTEWHNCVVWGKRAEGLGKILCKGSKVLVEGVLRTSNFEKDGTKHWRTEIVAREVELCGGAKKEEKPASNGGGRDDDDDIPF